MKLVYGGIIIAAAIAVSVLFFSISDIPPEQQPLPDEQKEIEVTKDKEQPATQIEPEPIETTSNEISYLIVNVEGDTHDKGWIIISGTIPEGPPRHLTGMVYSGIGIDVRVVNVFQIQLKEDNTFVHKVRINDDYLWKEDTKYTIAVKHGNLSKKVEFYRGTSINNFEDSMVPLI